MNIQGFTLTNKQEVPSCKGTLYEYVHNKTKAKLVWLSTKESNKLFSVAFRTFPENDTGVFHILEHSVLCGSDKYPVKEPFVELMKSSMNTFLNAMTFPDKTLYPVSSRNEKDFYHLTSVYLDAVFKPAIYTNPNIFYQEGWHYELNNKDEDPIYKGVVLNEMKGAEGSVDTLIQNEIMRMLYPDSCYGYVSGGDSRYITTLSYDEFLNNHRKYYHPSNAIFYLEGDLNLEETSKMILEYIDEYDEKEEIPFVLQEPVKAQEMIAYYDEENEKEHTYFVQSKIVGKFDDKRKTLAIDLLCDYLNSSNESPLMKAILEKNLGKDLDLYVNTGIAQPFFMLVIHQTDYEKREEIKKTIKEVITSIIEEGIDKKELEATINQIEFHLRQSPEPKALYHCFQVLKSGLYGGEMKEYLEYDEAFTFLREQLNTDYYEKLLTELFDEEYMQTLYMLPSKTKGQETADDEANRLHNAKASWNEEQLEEILTLNTELQRWQKTEDTKEQLATIPTLTLDDVDEVPEKKETIIKEVEGIKVLYHPHATEGIVYMNIYFTLPEHDETQLMYLNFFTTLFMEIGTKNKTLLQLNQDLKGNLGTFDTDELVLSRVGEEDEAQLYFVVTISVLESKIDDAVRLFKEVIYDTQFTNNKLIHQVLEQDLDDMHNGIVESGHQYAITNASASYTKENSIREALNGYTYYANFKQFMKNFDKEAENFKAYATSMQEHMIGKNNVLITTTGSFYNEEFVSKIIDAFNDNDLQFDSKKLHTPESNLGIRIPSQISYAALVTNFSKLQGELNGAWCVLSKIVSLAYLWNEVRVKGGAYGTGMTVSILGNIGFYSYRDPNASNSLEIFKKTAKFIEDFCNNDESFDNYIISSISDRERLLTPRRYGDAADTEYLRNNTYEYQCQLRKEMKNTSKEDLLACAKVLNELADHHVVTVVGSKNIVKKVKGLMTKDI